MTYKLNVLHTKQIKNSKETESVFVLTTCIPQYEYYLQEVECHGNMFNFKIYLPAMCIPVPLSQDDWHSCKCTRKQKQKRGKITILVGCGAASQGDWCPMFKDRVLISFSRVKMFITRTLS